MIIKVNVKPGSGREEVKKISNSEFDVWVREPAREGKANLRVVKLIARKFGVSSMAVKMKTLKGRKKIIEVLV